MPVSRSFALDVDWTANDGDYAAFTDKRLRSWLYANLLRDRNLVATDPRAPSFRVDRKGTLHLRAKTYKTYKVRPTWRQVLCTPCGTKKNPWIKATPCWLSDGQSRKKLFVRLKSNGTIGGFGCYLLALWSGKVTREGHAEWVKQMRRTFGKKEVYCHNEDVHWFHVKEWKARETTKDTTKGGKGGRKGHTRA